MKAILFNKYITLDCALERHYRKDLGGHNLASHGKFGEVHPVNVYKERVKNEYTIIILGMPGPTGKTWLANKLNEKGWKAIEISEMLCIDNVLSNGVINPHPFLVTYTDRYRDHVAIDDDKKVVVMILNKNIYGDGGRI